MVVLSILTSISLKLSFEVEGQWGGNPKVKELHFDRDDEHSNCSRSW